MSYSRWITIIFVATILFVASPMANTEANVADARLDTHRVVKGESLFLISRQYDITVEQLRKVNSLDSDMILIDQVLRLPAGVKATSARAATHQVVRGESLFLISRQYGIAVEELRRANNLTSDQILVGQILNLPQGAQPQRAVARVASRGSDASRFTENDIYWLAKIIHAEARGESYEGQVAVGAVVLNRVRSPLFPNTIYGVIFEKSQGRYYQFSPVLDGSINLEPNQSARNAARDAINGWDPSGGALYFYNPATSTNRWIFSLPVIKKIGKHVFARQP